MKKPTLLLVDADARSLRVLEVSLRKAGYRIKTSSDVADALAILEAEIPALIISDTTLGKSSGFDFLQKVRRNARHTRVPFIFLSSDAGVDQKVRGLQAGADDYLTKPMYIKEVLARVGLVLDRQERESLTSSDKTRFAGSLRDMGLADLLATVSTSKKSGVLTLTQGQMRGAIFFHVGEVIDAELGRATKEAAVLRAFALDEGLFDLEFREVRRQAKMKTSVDALVELGLKFAEEWDRASRSMGALSFALVVNERELAQRLADLPDEMNAVVRACDGKSSAWDLIDRVDGDDLSTLKAISVLQADGVLFASVPIASLAPPSLSPDALFTTDMVPGASNTLPPALLKSEAPRASGVTIGSGIREDFDTVVAAKPHTVSDGASMAFAKNAENSGSGRFPHAGTLSAMNAGFGVDATESDDDLDQDFSETESGDRLSPLAGEGGEEGSMSTKKAGSKRSSRSKKALVPENAHVVDDSNVIQFPSSKNRVVATPQVAVGERATAADEGEGAKPSTRPRRASRAPKQTLPPADMFSSPPPPSDPPVDGEAPQLELDGAVKSERPRRSRTSIPPKGRASKATQVEMIEAPNSEALAREIEANLHASKRPSQAPLPMMESSNTASKKLSQSGTHDALPPLAGEPSSQFSITGEHSGIHREFFNQHEEAVVKAAAEEGWLYEPYPEPNYKKYIWATLAAFGALLLIFGVWAVVTKDQSQPQAKAPKVESHLPSPAVVDAPKPAEVAPAVVVAPAPAPTPAPAEPVAEAPAPTTAPEELVAVVPAPVTVPAEPVAAAPAPTPAPASGDYAAAIAAARRARGPQLGAAWERAIAINPNGSEALGGYAFALLNRGDIRKAAELATRAVAADPTNAEGWITLGASRQELHDSPGAREAYKNCVERGVGKYVSECRAMAR